MSQSRRKRVEQGIYARLDASGEEVQRKDRNGKLSPVLEIGWRDAQGKQRWKVVDGGGIKSARAALAEAHADRKRGVKVAADPRMTFDRAADLWWEARASKLRPKTQATYTSCLTHLRAEFGRRRLTDITPADVALFVSAQSRSRKGWTVRGYLVVLSSVYRYAGRHLGFTGQNPVAQLDRVERPSTEDQRDKRILAPDELRRLIDAVDEPYRLIFEVDAETGLRLGEVLGLVWGDIDLDAATISVSHQISAKGVRSPLKTARARRVIEITPALVGKLREHKIGSPHSTEHSYVFTTRNGTPHDHRNAAGRVLSRAVKRAGLEAVTVGGEIVQHAPTMHSLRHSHGSALIAAGWDLEEVSARLGHSDVSITARAYVHAYDSARRSDERRNRLSALYGSADGSGKQFPSVSSSPDTESNVLQMARIADGAK